MIPTDLPKNTDIISLMNKEKELVNKLNSFYKAYADYVKCTSCSMNNNCRVTESDCSSAKGEFETKKLETTNLINEYINQINTVKQTTGDKINTANYNNRFNQIKEFHRKILNDRQNLDDKIDFINKTREKYDKSSDDETLSSIYTGIVLSVLATSLLYYVFIKI
jgi:hypothetical protein